MMFNEESLPYLEVFLEETDEQLQELEGKLVFLEKNPANCAVLDDIFRISHNLKGNAATVGFEEMAILAHRMEDLLDGMRKGGIHPSSEIIDTLFNALDALRGLADRACGKDEGILELESLVNKLEQLARGGSDIDTSVERSDTDTPVETKENELLIRLEDSCGMKAARACMVLKTLEELVKIIEAQPSFNEIKEHGFEDTEIKVRFFARKSPDVVKETLEAISDVKEVELLRGEIKEEKEVALRINVGKRLDLQALEERLRERYDSQVVIDLTDLCELSPAGLSWLLWACSLTGVEFILPRYSLRKNFLELLGFGENVRHSFVVQKKGRNIMDSRKRIVFESDKEYFENLRKFLIFIKVNKMTDSEISRSDEIPDSLIHQWVDLTIEKEDKEY